MSTLARDPELEAALTRGLRELGARGGEPPDLWPALAARLDARRRRVGPLQLAALVACLLLLCANTVAYFIPRAGVALAEAVRSTPAGLGAVAGSLYPDPGVFGLLTAKAFLPVQVSTTEHGATLALLGAYFDGQATVLPFQVRSAPGSPATQYAQNWTPVLSNADLITWNAFGPSGGMAAAPGIRHYAVTLSDQFGTLSVGHFSVDGQNGVGAFVFPGVPGWMRAGGLRLTLRVQAMERVLAPDGPLGPKSVQIVRGPWTAAFAVFPPPVPTLTLTPDSRASLPGGGTLILRSVVDVPSGTYLTVTAPDNRLLLGPRSGWTLTDPSGAAVTALSATAINGRMRLQFAPLTEAGTYRLTNAQGATLSWTQPAWNTQFTWQATPPPPPLYTGTHWGTAARIAGLPVLHPPVGARIVQVTVTPATGQPRRAVPAPRQIDVRLQTPAGLLDVVESAAWLTPLPPPATAEQFAASLQRGSPPGSYRRLTVAGEPAQLWGLPGPGGSVIPTVDVYPPWGSVSVTMVAPSAAAPAGSGPQSVVAVAAVLVRGSG